MVNKRAILLLSGGIDSTTLLAKLNSEKYEVFAISFNYGQKHRVELNYAKKNAAKYNVKSHQIINLDNALFTSSALVNPELSVMTYENSELPQGETNAYVPFRNLIFTSIAMSIAESLNIEEVFIAVNVEDSHNFWDCKLGFFEKINTLCYSNGRAKISTPFIGLTKSNIIELANKLSVDLKDTITCYQPFESIECGICLSCINKQQALRNAKI